MTRPTAWQPRGLMAFGLTVVVLLLAYLPGLTVATVLPDEVVYLDAGLAYLQGDTGANPEHPPLGKLAFGVGQWVVGDRVLGGRLVAVAAGLAIAAALFVVVRRVAGRGWGLAAAAAWALLPHALRWSGDPWGGFDKLDRYAMLDPVAAALAVWAVVVAVRWSHDRRYRWGALAGALVGLAGAAKLSALLLLPVVALVALLGRDHPVRHRLVSLAAVTAGAIGGFIAVYLPVAAEAPFALSQMVSFQAEHATAGHRIMIAGTVYDRAPWWANLYYQWRDDGPLLTAALLVAAVAGAAAGAVGREARLLLAAAVAVPVAVLAVSSVALPHYRFLWLAPTVALAVLGVRELAGRGWSGRLAAVAVAVVVAATGAVTVWDTATQGTRDYRELSALLDRAGPSPSVLVHGYPQIVTFYRPGVRLVTELPADVVVLDPQLTDRHPVPEELRDRLARGGYERVSVDRLRVWVRTGAGSTGGAQVGGGP